MAEQWVRPPVVAREASSTTAARWRFRVLTGLLLAVVGLLVFLLFLKVAGVTSEDPGLGVGLTPARTPSTTASVWGAPAAR